MCKVAVIGYGVVGSGTVELFMKNRESISKKVGKECDIKYILDLRDFPDSPFADKMIKDFNIILNDAEVEVVAEVVGGTTFAYDYTKKLLEHGIYASESLSEFSYHGRKTQTRSLGHRCSRCYQYGA